MKNIAVIGVGYWGKNLVRNFHQLGALHTVCDSVVNRLDSIKKEYPDINICTNYADLLKNPEISGVVISTPVEFHYEMARAALENGKDVFVEKPMCLTAEEGIKLNQIAKNMGRILMVDHLLQFHTAVIKLKEMIHNGELGRIYYIYSSRLNLGKIRREENILWSFAPHDISVILSLVKELPDSVSSHGGYYLHNTIADVTMSILNFPSGVKSHIFVSWIHPFKEQKLIVVGDRKMVVFDDVATVNKLLLYPHQIEWRDNVPVPEKENAIPVPFEMKEPLHEGCKHFLECMQTRNNPRTDGKEGIKVLKILEACQSSLDENGKVVYLKSKNDTLKEISQHFQEQKEYFAHPTAVIEEPCEIGEGTKIWHFSHILPNCKIGTKCNIGQNVVIFQNVVIGSNVKIQNNISVFEGVIIEDDVFCGPSMVFTNISNPRSHVSRRKEYKQTLVKKGATIGANATILCDHTIGRYAFIGAGAVVTKDVPDYALVVGNPAKIVGWTCECGIKLDFNNNMLALCTCGKSYEKKGEKVNLLDSEN